MVKRIAAISMCLLVCALCLALAGCGDNKAGFIGEWTLESGSDQTLDAASVELVKSYGYTVTITLNEEGDGTLDLFHKETPLTWEATGATQGSLVLGDTRQATMRLTDGKLVVEDSAGSNMVFVKVPAPSSA